MRICVIDGRGGGLGGRLIERLLAVVDERHEVSRLAPIKQPPTRCRKLEHGTWVLENGRFFAPLLKPT